MIDMNRLKQKLLNTKETRNKEYAKISTVFCEFLSNTHSTEVNFNKFTLTDALKALEEIEMYRTDEDLLYDEDPNGNKDNLLHRFSAIDSIAWQKIYKLPPKKTGIEYF